MMRMAVFSAVTAVGLALNAGPAVAQGTSSQALAAARELSAITTAGMLPQIMTTYTDRVWPAVEASIRKSNPKLDAATAGELRKEFLQLQVALLRDVMAEAAPVYVRLFTLKELRELVAFYKTPTGKKAIVTMPQASMELLAGLAPRLNSMSQTITDKFSAILKARGFNP